MTVLVAGNVTAAGSSICLDLSPWEGDRTREVMWGCEFPPASSEWFVYLPALRLQLVVDRRGGAAVVNADSAT